MPNAFEALDAEEQRTRLLAAISARVVAPIDTYELAKTLAADLGGSPGGLGVLLARMAFGHPMARHNGVEYKNRFGQTCRSWRWSPRGTDMVPASAGPVDEETPEAYRARIVAEGARREALAQALQSAKANVSDEDW